MRNLEHGKLIYFLSALPAGELTTFRDYLHSPVFNEKEEPRRLYDHIVKKCLKPPIREIDDSKALQAVWPGAPGDPVRLQKLKSALMNLLISFLEFRHWRASPAWSGVGLLHQLNVLGDESYFEQYYRRVKADLHKEPSMDMDALTAQLDMEVAFMNHRQVHGQRSADNHLDVTLAAMGRVVHGHVLRFAFIIANQRMIVGGEIPAWIQAHIAQIQPAEIAGEPLLEIYYLLYQTHGSAATHAQLTLLKERLVMYAHRCPAQEAHDLYTGTINNFNRFAQQGGHNLLEEVFELYQSLVALVTQKVGMSLSHSHFKNIVYLGSRLGKFAWVQQLLSNGSKWLDGEDPATTLAYNTGVLHFYKQEFAMAERSFNRVLADVKDVFYAFDARMYLLMSLFETGDSLGMETLIHSFRMLLERSDRVSEQHKNAYLSFIRVFRKLLSTPPNDATRKQQLRAEIELLGLSAGRVWMLGKVG